MRGSAAFRTGVAPGGALAPGWVKNELWRKARTVPSLDLRFADDKSLIDATTGASLVTFTRASSGTFVGSDGVLRTAATNEPRFDHNPTTGESLGLLVEEQRTNLVLRSEDFATTWTKVAATVTADAIVSPTGVLNADKLVETIANSAHYAVQSVSVTTTSRTASIYLKAGERTQARIEHSGNTGGAGRRITINLSTGAITGASTIGTGGLNSFSESIASVGNGWYRVTSTIDPTVTLGNTQALVVLILDNTGSATYVGDDTSGIYLWGAQLEAGAFPTSYIPTTTAAATRSADVASITGTAFSSWYRQDEGTVFADAPGIYSTGSVFTFSDGSNNNRTLLDHGTNTRRTRFISGNIEQAAFSPSYIYGTQLKTGISYASNYFSMANAGVLASGAPDTSCSLPVGIDRIFIGSNSTGAGQYANTTIRRLTFWPTRLPDNTLQSITQ